MESILDSNRMGAEALRHLQRLAVEIGPRTIGSSGNHAAAAYTAAQFEAAGLTVTTQSFDCPDWAEEHTALTLGGEVLEAFANTFSPACDLTAPTLAVGTLAELAAADIAGRIVIFYGDLAQHEIAAKGAIYVSPRDREIVRILEERGPAAVLTVNPSLHAHWRLIEDFDLDLPSATVTARSGLQLLQAAGLPVRLQIAARRAPSHSSNVIGHRRGERPERIVLCAHYDTKVDTVGAYDNAAGVAALLTLATHLAALPLRHALEFVAFSGEEIYGLGDMTYARERGDFANIVAAINLDGVGPRLGTNTVAVFAASMAFSDMVQGTLAAYPGMVRVDPWPASDHYIFYSNGVPSLALTSAGIKDIYHTPFDTAEWISAEKLGEAVRFVSEFVSAVDGQPAGWHRPANETMANSFQ